MKAACLLLAAAVSLSLPNASWAQRQNQNRKQSAEKTPADLAVFYPFPLAGIPAWKSAASLALLAAISTLALRLRHRPWIAAGWGWYLLTLLPVIEFGGHAGYNWLAGDENSDAIPWWNAGLQAAIIF